MNRYEYLQHLNQAATEKEIERRAAREQARTMTSKQPTTRQIAFNPITRKWEVVHAEDEVPAAKIITQYWSGTIEKWVTIPQD